MTISSSALRNCTMRVALPLLFLAAVFAALLVLAPTSAQAAPTMKEGEPYVASIKWSKATGTSFTSLLHNQAVVLRQGGVYYIGLPSVSAAADKKITKLTYGTKGDAAATEATDDNTRIFIFPVSTLDQPVTVGVQQSGKKGTARLSIDTSSLQLVPSEATWQRLSGANALDTMAAVVKAGFSKSTYAILAANSGYWDALSASGLAGIYQCPILLTDGAALSSQASGQLKRMGVTNIFIVGGRGSISEAVEREVAKLGYKVERIGGKTAIDTSFLIWQHEKGKWGSDVITATFDGYWDALSISPYAYAAKAPVLLHDNYSGQVSWRGSANHKLLTQVASGDQRVVIAGGGGSVSKSVDAAFPNSVRLSGANAYETSAAVASWCMKQGMKANNLGIATGQGYWDALVAGPFCGKKNSVLLLADDGNLTNVSGFVRANAASIDAGYIFGGRGSVGTMTMELAQIATSETGILTSGSLSI